MGERRIFHSLDGLRGVAAIAVAWRHVAAMAGFPVLVPHSYLAVDFFFALSGFVIAHAYEGRMPALGFFGFLRVRVIRLWPVIVLSMLIGAVGALKVDYRPLPDVLDALWRGVLLFPHTGRSLAAANPFPLNPPAWSLFYEMVVNIAWALVAVRLGVRSLVVIVVIAAFWLAIQTGRFSTFGQADDMLRGAVRVCLGFSLGVLCHKLHGRVKMSAPPWLLAVAILGVFLLPTIPVFADVAIICLVFPFVLLLGAGSHANGPLLRLSGDISYPLYGLHWPLAALLIAVMHRAWPAGIALVPLLVLGAVWLALVVYDIPVRRFLTRLRLRGLAYGVP